MPARRARGGIRRPFTGECLGVIEPIRVVLPGNEAGTYRAIVCEDLDEAAPPDDTAT